MKHGYLATACILAALCIGGCMSPMGRPDYTASGALVGGATGAIIGSMSKHTGTGAAIGAVVGGLIGHDMDQEQEARLRAQAPQTMQRVEQGEPLTVSDVESLVKAGIGDDIIISQIRNSRTIYHLTTTDIIALKNNGVSERIIDYMINTPSQASSSEVSRVVGQTPPPPQPDPVTAAPGPGFIWVPGAWIWLEGCWEWHRGYWHRPMHPAPYRFR